MNFELENNGERNRNRKRDCWAAILTTRPKWATHSPAWPINTPPCTLSTVVQAPPDSYLRTFLWLMGSGSQPNPHVGDASYLFSQNPRRDSTNTQNSGCRCDRAYLVVAISQLLHPRPPSSKPLHAPQPVSRSSREKYRTAAATADHLSHHCEDPR